MEHGVGGHPAVPPHPLPMPSGVGVGVGVASATTEGGGVGGGSDAMEPLASSTPPSAYPRGHGAAPPPTTTTMGGVGSQYSYHSEDDDDDDDDDGGYEMSLTELLYSAASYHAIAKPVSLTMILAATATVVINTADTIEQGEAQMAAAYNVWSIDTEHGTKGQTLAISLANSFVIVSFICVLTFGIVLLYKFRCMKCLVGYMITSSATLLGVLGGTMFDVAIEKYRLAIDQFSFYFALYNFALVGVYAVFYQKGVPTWVTQGYLVCTSIILAWQLSHFDEWTTWTLLVMLGLYDLCAVLTPCGPLRALVTLMQKDDAPDMPGLLYEAALPREAQRPGGGSVSRARGTEQRDDDANGSSNVNGGRSSSGRGERSGGGGGDGAGGVGGSGGRLSSGVEARAEWQAESEEAPPTTTGTAPTTPQRKLNSADDALAEYQADAAAAAAAASTAGGGIGSAASTAAGSVEMSTTVVNNGTTAVGGASASDASAASSTAAAPPTQPPPPPPTAVIPLAIARIYRLPLASGLPHPPPSLASSPSRNRSSRRSGRYPRSNSGSSVSTSPLLAAADGNGSGGSGGESDTSRPSSPSLPEHASTTNATTDPGTDVSYDPTSSRTYTPAELCTDVVAVLPRNGGKIVKRGIGSDGPRYAVLDRTGNVKRILVVDKQGKVFEETDDDEEEKVANSIKLGLGDFIFYSVLVSKAAQHSFATFAACFLVILAGLGGTLVLLAVFHHALPALPISIFLAVIFYLLTRAMIEPWLEDIMRLPYYV